MRALVLAFVAVVLVGCGEDDDDRRQAFCEEVTEQQGPLTDILADQTATGLIEALPRFEELAEKAPSDISGEWEIVTDRIGELGAALDAAGVEPGEYDRENPPPGVTPSEKSAIDEAAKGLTAARTVEALEHVQQHAKDVCHKPLSLA